MPTYNHIRFRDVNELANLAATTLDNLLALRLRCYVHGKLTLLDLLQVGVAQVDTDPDQCTRGHWQDTVLTHVDELAADLDATKIKHSGVHYVTPKYVHQIAIRIQLALVPGEPAANGPTQG